MRLGGLLLVMLGACGPQVEGHAVATHTPVDAAHIDASQVRVSAVAIPVGATELGIVQAHTVQGSIEDAAPEFAKQVALLGGDFGKINDVGTKFEMTTRTRTESYSCGTSTSPRTCTRTVTETVELATTRIIGMAYRMAPTPKAPPSAQEGSSPKRAPIAQ